jgi:enoyl-CoA hydratase/carnithine racemase
MNSGNWEHHAQLSTDEHGVATLRIVNAGSLNILGTPVVESLRAALAVAASQPDVRVVVLRGDGDKAFVAGADIKEMADFDAARASGFIDGLRQLCEAVRQLTVPVIARIPGAVATACRPGACELDAADRRGCGCAGSAVIRPAGSRCARRRA